MTIEPSMAADERRYPHALFYGERNALVHSARFDDPARLERAYHAAVARAARAWQAFEDACVELGACDPRRATTQTSRGWKTFEGEFRGRWTLRILPGPAVDPPATIEHPELGARIEATLERGMIRNRTMLLMRELFDEAVRRRFSDVTAFGTTYRVEHAGRVYWFVGGGDRAYPRLMPLVGDGEQRVVVL